ncbi:MAG: dehydrogenase protein, partial [Rhodospirillales bacterium]|nr:dehydrogenase protein [Rhodospirillales bacterium]
MTLKVVIVGAGFGGLEAAKKLAGASVDLTILDRQNHHCFQPLLYQVATAALSPGDVAWPIRGILRDQKNARVLMANVTGVDVEHRTVLTDDLDVPYDILILATGATHSYFGHDEWSEFAPGLKKIEDATSIRRRLLLAFERAERCPDDAGRRQLLTFVIIGGGPTGVELAGAVAELARNSLAGEFRSIDPKAARVVLVEAGERLLPAFPQELSLYTRRALERAGVEVLTGTMVTHCDGAGVQTTTGAIASATLMWAAGVVASPAARWLGVPADRAGRVQTEADLTIAGHPEIFVIGDTAAVRDHDGRPVPGIASAAKQMGQFVGQAILTRLAGRSHGTFNYRHQGDLATIGRKAAVVSLGRFRLKGFLGWV